MPLAIAIRSFSVIWDLLPILLLLWQVTDRLSHNSTRRCKSADVNAILYIVSLFADVSATPLFFILAFTFASKVTDILFENYEKPIASSNGIC